MVLKEGGIVWGPLKRRVGSWPGQHPFLCGWKVRIPVGWVEPAKPNNLISMQYHRSIVRGGVFFFTMVTFRRQPILRREENVKHLRAAFKYVKNEHPFIIEAIAILPDHIHFILKLPDNDLDYPTRLRLIKTYFSRRCSKADERVPPSRMQKKERAVWQRRYWEHTIRDDDDFRLHVEHAGERIPRSLLRG